MIKNKLLLISCILFAPKALSIGGVGDVVSDPISYTYYVEEIKKVTAMIAEQKRNVEQVMGLRNGLDALTAEFKGAYNNAMGVVSAIGGLADEIKGIPDSIEIGKRELKDIGDDYAQYAEIDENLHEAFNDPRSSYYNPDLSSAYKYNMQQLTNKNVIRASTTMLDSQADRLDKLLEISEKIDNTENVKDATDLTNRFLSELVQGQLQILAVLSHTAKMQALNNYTGYEIDTANDEIDKQEGRKPENDTRVFSFSKEVLSYEQE